jgi:hypothetical protein
LITATKKFQIGLVLLASMSAAHAAPDAQEILAASDAIRNPSRPFSLTTTLSEYKEGKLTSSSTLEIYSKANVSNGQFRSLLRFVAPARDTDKLMLKSGNDLWFYDPSSKASVPISAQQRLLGQAANGDVVTVDLAKAYKAVIETEEDIQDGERKNRHCYKLALAASNADVTYQRVEMWIDVSNSRPVKARFFSESGHLLKTAYYRHFLPALGADRPTEVVIIDGLNPKLVTVMGYSKYVFRDIPESWLQREYLPRFKTD